MEPPPYGHLIITATFSWLPGKNDHTFSCKETHVNMVTSLLWPMSFGPLVTVLTGFHCMMFFTLECIGFNNILAHTWALFIPHLSAVSNLSNHIILVSWMGDIKAKSIGSPAYFSPPHTAQLVFVLPCSTWEPVCRLVFFFFF